MKLEEMKITELFDTSHTIAAKLFEGKTYPWEVLEDIGSFIEELGPTLPQNEYRKVGKNIWIHRTARLAPTIAMGGPAIICAHADVRQSAFIRGRVIVGEGAVVGNSCEIKNAVLFDGVQVPHFNYVGDSILGYQAHMGAGAITSNVKSTKTLVSVHAEGGDQETGLKKFGAMLGDGAEVGCNSVLNPGTVIGKNSIVYPLSNVRGCVAANSIYKAKEVIAAKEDRKEEASEAKAAAEETAAAAPAKKTRTRKSTSGTSKSLKVVK